MIRLLALFIVVIPGIAAVWGIKLMRDTLFKILIPPFPVLWLQFISGFLLLLLGLFFIGGFIFYRDKKRNKVQTRFKK